MGKLHRGERLEYQPIPGSPELHAIHDKGNEENLFDRVDYQVTGADTIHTNFQYTRSWFQTPNTIDNLNSNVPNPVVAGTTLPAQDQRAQIRRLTSRRCGPA